MDIALTRAQARHFLVCYQGLGAPPAVGEKAVLRFFGRVGCIQYDPLNVVGRNADLVLQARIRDDSPALLRALLYEKRCLVDGWDKMMAIYPTEDFPAMARVRQKNEPDLRRVLTHRNSAEALEHLPEVREALAQRGPLQGGQLSLGHAAEKGGWGHNRFSSVALDYLFHTGEAGIAEKRGTQKLYDLNSRLLPGIWDAPDPFADEHAFVRWYVARRVGSVGLLWGKKGGGWLGQYLDEDSLRQSVLEELYRDNELMHVQVEGIPRVFYMRRQDADFLGCSASPRQARFLAPLDNLLWDRDMVRQLFDFDYSWEVYVPQAKRKYGYYVLPVLVGNELVARFEPEPFRGEEALRVKNWWWQAELRPTAGMRAAIAREFDRFCRYLGAQRVEFRGDDPRCATARQK
ncbi:MAG: crosslink repair DNA glycosylase YcaQ family protein [Eubacteriales bacterium]|nr:crosslink repair DNA glycosylase YcaQ family protein [Eubacteriales bacterium]